MNNLKNKDLLNQAKGKPSKSWKAALSLLLCFVLLASLVVPIAGHLQTADGARAEHAHTDDCFAPEQRTICGMAEGEGAIVESTPGYAHSDACSTWCTETEAYILTCTEPERAAGETVLSSGHVHTDACFETTIILTCTQSETNAQNDETNDKNEATDPNADADGQTTSGGGR